MNPWLLNAERIDSAWTGGTYLTTVPWRFVAHTTEVVPSSLAGAKAMAARHEYPPHLWAWPQRGWLGQTVPLDRSAAALKRGNPPAGNATNKARAIQVEIIGHAIETPTWPEDWWGWLGEEVLAPVVAAGIPINLHNIANLLPYPASYGATSARMGWATWKTFDGVSAHLNVPDNEHGDIGAGRLDLMAAAARRKLTPQEDDLDMNTDELKQAVREVLNEGTGTGKRTWAETNKVDYKASIETHAMVTKLSDPATFAAALAPALAEHLPDLGDLDLEEVLRGLLPDIRIELADPGEG